MIVTEGRTSDGDGVTFVARVPGELHVQVTHDLDDETALHFQDPATLAELVAAATGSLESLTRALLEQRPATGALAVPGDLSTRLAYARAQLDRSVANLSQL